MRFGETTSQLLYNFEEFCMEDYLRQQNIQGQYSMQGTMQRISDRYGGCFPSFMRLGVWGGVYVG